MAKTQTTNQQKKHVARTLFAALLGFLALWLILSSVLAVWLDRTLTDTNTYVNTVAPLASQPDIQNYVADAMTKQVIDNASVPELAATLLPPAQIANETPEVVKAQLETTMQKSVLQILSSPNFAAVWASTNRDNHAQLISQLQSGSPQLSLDISPIFRVVLDQLKQTSLAPIRDKLKYDETAGKIELTGNLITRLHDYYSWFQRGTVAIVVAAFVLAICAIIISVHHAKTLRRMLMFTGVTSAFMALVLYLPQLVTSHPLGANELQFKAAVAVEAALTHNLLLSFIVIAVLCFVGAYASKLYSKRQSSTTH